MCVHWMQPWSCCRCSLALFPSCKMMKTSSRCVAHLSSLYLRAAVCFHALTVCLFCVSMCLCLCALAVQNVLEAIHRCIDRLGYAHWFLVETARSGTATADVDAGASTDTSTDTSACNDSGNAE